MVIVVSSGQQSFIFSVDLKIMYLSEELEEWSIGILLYLISFFNNKRLQWYGNYWCRVLLREPQSYIHFLSFNLLFTAFSIVILSPNPIKQDIESLRNRFKRYCLIRALLFTESQFKPVYWRINFLSVSSSNYWLISWKYALVVHKVSDSFVLLNHQSLRVL